MIEEEGSIGYIIDLLEDPEDARYNLKPELEAVKKTAKKCLDAAKAITSKFEYWYLVIIHLKQTGLTKKGKCLTRIIKAQKEQILIQMIKRRLTVGQITGEIIKERDKTKVLQTGAKQDEQKYEAEKKSLEFKIQTVQKQIEAAERDTDRARAELDRLQSQPVAIEPSVWEDIERVRRAVPDMGPQAKGEISTRYKMLMTACLFFQQTVGSS
jgi:hypothetical protein